MGIVQTSRYTSRAPGLEDEAIHPKFPISRPELPFYVHTSLSELHLCTKQVDPDVLHLVLYVIALVMMTNIHRDQPE
ncbi:hypothetical protein E4T56_gene19023 [Termitomyces sp. T112]|nr:hypothetical protein E4T56_gene19023 [Termitomyces sp. T112]